MRAAMPNQLLLRFAGVGLAGMALAGCNDAKRVDPADQIGANPVLPAPHEYLVPPMALAKSAPWGNETPTAPAGLQVRMLAGDLKNPRQIFVLPNDDVLVVETRGPKPPINRPKDFVMGVVRSFVDSGAKGANRITLLRGIGSDGVAKTRTMFLDHLDSPFGIALVGNDLYVADTDALLRFPYKEGDTSIVAPATKVTDLPAGPIDHHWTKSLVASPDGTKLYVGVGSNSNITENGIGAELDRAQIWEVDRATGLKRPYATGIRNPTGVQFEPKTGQLWAVANERDELGPDLVPDYLTSVKDGAFYGWPYSYYGQHLDPRVMPQRPDLVAKAIPPDYALSSHVAPLGLAFATGTSFPQSYQGGVFVSEHGSWDRSPLSGYKVVYVPFADGVPSGKAQDFLTGFLTADGHARGRPVGVAVDKTGALLVADDLADKVWRVSAAAKQASR